MRIPKLRRKPVKLAAAVAALSMAATLAACAEDGAGGGGGGGESVEFGASKETYVKALENLDPVTLVMQSTAPKGAATGRRFEEYAAAVDEWSGGKIKMDIAYANSIAPQDQVDDAIADSRLDVGSVMASLEPDKFPAMDTLMGLTFLGRQGPVNAVLDFHGAMAGAAFSSEEITQEYEDKGLKLLLPIFSSGPTVIACSKPITGENALKGRIVATQSRVQVEQAKALGMSTATANYTEVYEAIERGVVDCVMTTLATASLSGFIEAAPYFAVDYKVGFGNAGGAITISQDRWDELPLAAQQLLFDRIDVVLEANIRGIWANMTNSLAEIKKAGGSITVLDETDVATLQGANDELLAKAEKSTTVGDGKEFVSNLQTGIAEWETAVDGLEQETDVAYDQFLDAFDPDGFDMKPYLDLVWEKDFLAQRPE